MATAFNTPEFARIEIKMSGKTGLRKTADKLRELASTIDEIARASHSDDTADLIAWQTIKAASQKLRSGA
jgi:hypothetical protein